MDWEEACRILGVDAAASSEEIRQQYHYKAQLLHPDATIGKSESIRRKAEDEFKVINQAYQFLTNPLNNPFTNPPKLRISPKHIRFRDMGIRQKKITTSEIDNVGGPYTNIWFEREPCPWLSVTSFESTTAHQLPMKVTIECTGIGDPGRQYSCKLPVRLENEKTKLKDEVLIDIELWTKAESPVLYSDILRIEFRQVTVASREARNLVLSNLGRGALQGTISTTKPWLSVVPGVVGLAQGEIRSYSVIVNTDNLPAGYAGRGEVQISTNGGNATLAVDLSVPQLTKEEHPNYSAKAFAKRFFLVLAIPFIPPILVGTVYLLGYLAEKSLLWLFVVPLVVTAIVLGDKKAREEGRAAKVPKPPHQPQIIVTPRQPQQSATPAPLPSIQVVANSFSSIYHTPSCKWARKISRRNRVYISKDEARRRGYIPCSACHP
jgi:hypothetical protein